MSKQKFKIMFLTTFIMTVLLISTGMSSRAEESAPVAPQNLKQIDDLNYNADTKEDAYKCDYGYENVYITWDKVDGASYYVFFSTDNKNFSRLNTFNVDYNRADTSNPRDNYNPQFTIKGLAPGASYYVKIVAVKKQFIDDEEREYVYIESPESNVLEVVTKPNISDAKVKQIGATTSGFTVKVDNVSGANYYELCEIGLDKGKVYGSSNTNIIEATKLKVDNQYKIEVYMGRKSSSGYVAMHKKTYKYIYCKTQAKKLSKSESGIFGYFYGGYDIAFGYLSDNYIDGYQLQIFNINGKKLKTITRKKELVYQSNYGIRVSGYTNGKPYKYRLRSYIDADGTKIYGAWSDYKTIAVPKKVTAKTDYKKRIFNMSWTAVTGAEKYNVYISTKENKGYIKAGTVSSKKRKIKITKFGKKKFKKNTTYYVKLVPVVKIGSKKVEIQNCYRTSFRFTGYMEK